MRRAGFVSVRLEARPDHCNDETRRVSGVSGVKRFRVFVGRKESGRRAEPGQWSRFLGQTAVGDRRSNGVVAIASDVGEISRSLTAATAPLATHVRAETTTRCSVAMAARTPEGCWSETIPSAVTPQFQICGLVRGGSDTIRREKFNMPQS